MMSAGGSRGGGGLEPIDLMSRGGEQTAVDIAVGHSLATSDLHLHSFRPRLRLLPSAEAAISHRFN